MERDFTSKPWQYAINTAVTVGAKVLSCREVRNALVKCSLVNFVDRQILGIEEYFNSTGCSGCKIDVSHSIFIIDPQKLSQVRIRIPFYKNNKSNIVGDISLELSIDGAQCKRDIVDFLSTVNSEKLKFSIDTSSPGKGVGVMSKFLYCDVQTLKLVVTDAPIVVYFSKIQSKNIYKSHALIQETEDGNILKKIYF